MIIWGGFSVKKQQNLEIISFHFMIIWDFYGSSAKKESNLGISDSTHEFFPQQTTKHHGLFGQRSGKDILLYRGELARCADLLAFQLGKELLFRQFFWGRPTKIPGAKRSFWVKQYIYKPRTEPQMTTWKKLGTC